jgi:hypothetical protein
MRHRIIRPTLVIVLHVLLHLLDDGMLGPRLRKHL